MQKQKIRQKDIWARHLESYQVPIEEPVGMAALSKILASVTIVWGPDSGSALHPALNKLWDQLCK